MYLKYEHEYQNEEERRVQLNIMLGFVRKLDAPGCIQNALIDGKIWSKGKEYKVIPYLLYKNNKWVIKNERYTSLSNENYGDWRTLYDAKRI